MSSSRKVFEDLLPLPIPRMKNFNYDSNDDFYDNDANLRYKQIQNKNGSGPGSIMSLAATQILGIQPSSTRNRAGSAFSQGNYLTNSSKETNRQSGGGSYNIQSNRSPINKYSTLEISILSVKDMRVPRPKAIDHHV